MPEPTITVDEELPGAPRPARWRPILLVAVLVVAFGAGVGVGYRSRDGEPAVAPTRGGPASVTGTGFRCSEQIRTSPTLWLGAELLNQGPGPIVVSDLRVDVPLGGMRLGTRGWIACGQSAGPRWTEGGPPSIEVAENATLWMSVVVVLTEPDVCPAPYPVWFTVDYTDATGTPGQRQLGFVDLGDVSYTACDTEES